MKGGPSVAVSLIAVEDAGLALVPNRKRHTQQHRCFHDSCSVAVAVIAGLCSHLEKRPLGRGKRWIEKQPWCLEGVEEGSERAPGSSRRQLQ
jgi:hypothetical protein